MLVCVVENRLEILCNIFDKYLLRFISSQSWLEKTWYFFKFHGQLFGLLTFHESYFVDKDALWLLLHRTLQLTGTVPVEDEGRQAHLPVDFSEFLVF